MSEQAQTTRGDSKTQSNRLASIILFITAGFVMYVLSTGPVIGLAFFYFAQTGNHLPLEFTQAFYYPLTMLPQDWTFMELLEQYVTFWIEDVFQIKL